MRAYIRENLKSIISVTVLIICTIAFICTNELVAKKLPEISTLEAVKVKLTEGKVYDYTGKEIEPEVKYILFKDEEGTEIKKAQTEITSVQYKNNKKVGSASMEVQVMGYQGSLVIKDVFSIRPAKVEKLEISNSSRTNIDLVWKKTGGADGYLVSKSADNGASYTTVMDITDSDVTTYQDTDLQTNTTYMYYITAYAMIEDEQVFGEVSETVSQITPLDTPVFTSVQGVSHNTIQLQWNAVNGAVSYEVYRSLTKDGEYTCIAEIADGAATSFADATCDCGIEYFYYIKAAQSLDGNNVYGDASEISSARAIPNKVSLTGSVSQDQTQVTLTWKETLGAHGFEIYRSVDNTSNFQLVQKIEQSNVYSWTDTGLNKDTEYHYKVRAYCVVDGHTVTGNYSNSFMKEVVINYNYAELSGNISAILQYTNVSYVSGGYTPKGWDCSGFTQWAMKQCFGVSIPKAAASQGAGGKTISKTDRSQWIPGDILCYTEGGGVSHVALYLGDGKIMHALSTKYDTVIHDVDYYEKWDKATTLHSVKRWH